MAALKLRTTPDRNRSKKYDENTIYRPQAIQGVI
jgi:hypothetical protein